MTFFTNMIQVIYSRNMDSNHIFTSKKSLNRKNKEIFQVYIHILLYYEKNYFIFRRLNYKQF